MGTIKTYYISTDIIGGELNPGKLATEVMASGYVAGCEGISVEGDTIFVLGESVLNAAGLNTLVANHVAVTLDEYKDIKNKEIDKRTNQLIGAGFTYDSNTFSLSLAAQVNWLGVRSMKDLMTFPVNIATIDNNQYSLAEAHVDAFVGTGITTLQSHLDSGRGLKVTVNAATSKAGVDSVEDTR